jgi:hypothetical protein
MLRAHVLDPPRTARILAAWAVAAWLAWLLMR